MDLNIDKLQEHSAVNKNTTEEISQLESSQGIVESIEGIVPEEFSQGNMNIEEEPQEENPTEGTTDEDQNPVEQTGSKKGTVVPLRKRKKLTEIENLWRE